MISCFNKLNFNSHKKQVIKSLFALHFRAQFFPLPVCNVSKLNLVPTSQADFQMFLNKYQIFGRFFTSLHRIKCKNIAVGLPSEWKWSIQIMIYHWEIRDMSPVSSAPQQSRSHRGRNQTHWLLNSIKRYCYMALSCQYWWEGETQTSVKSGFLQRYCQDTRRKLVPNLAKKIKNI